MPEAVPTYRFRISAFDGEGAQYGVLTPESEEGDVLKIIGMYADFIRPYKNLQIVRVDGKVQD